MEQAYAVAMALFFSVVYLTLLVLTLTLVYDGILEYVLQKQGTGSGFFSGIIGTILLAGFLWALFPKTKEGSVLKRKDAPKLFDMVDRAVAQTGIHPINTIRLIPGSSIAVTGFFNKQLLIGIASLRYIVDKDFEAILYHEIGHFAAKDTKMSSILSIYFQTIEKQNASSVNYWKYAPHYALAFIGLPSLAATWVLLQIFSFLYAPYSKFKEYKADEFAVEHSSSQQFADALVHYATYSFAHDVIMPRIVVQLLAEKKVLHNVYETMTKNWNKQTAEEAMKSVVNAKEHFLDSHPSLANRLKKLNIRKVGKNNGKPLKDLLVDSEAYEKQLSDNYTIRVGINAGLLAKSTKRLT
jgi:Zn-dependent protease with chaperone function